MNARRASVFLFFIVRRMQYTKWTASYLQMDFAASASEVAQEIVVDPSGDGTWRVTG